jgi:predicted transcriptional regulator
MSSDNHTPDASSDGDDSPSRRAELARTLVRGGWNDVHVVSRETAREVLSDRRTEIVETLRATDDIASVRDLARRLDRDKGHVSRDLAVLAEHGIVGYDSDGRAKAPRLTHEHVVIEPVV